MDEVYELVKPFEYSIIWLILGIIILLSIFCCAIWYFFFKKKSPVESKNIIKFEKPKNIEDIKTEYLKLIDEVERECQSNKVNYRNSYIRLSSIVRTFVYKATGIEVHKSTLSDIKALNMPSLYNLIREFYTPEFAENTKSNILKAINDTRQVIKTWN